MDINRHRLNRPAVLVGGQPVVQPTPVRPTDRKRPRATPEQRYAAMIGRDDDGRKAIVIGFSNGAVARTVACLALLRYRFEIQGRPWPRRLEAVTSVLAPEATLLALTNAHLAPKLVDVGPATGCASVSALRAWITEETALLAVPVAFDRLPELSMIETLADSKQIGFLLDLRQSHMAMYHGIHAATYAHITTVWGDGLMDDVLGREVAFLVTFDPKLAELIRTVHAGAAGLGWGRGNRAAMHAPLAHYRFDMYDDQNPVVAQTLGGLAAGLANASSPWRLLPPQPSASGALDAATVVFDPTTSRRAEAWARIGRRAAGAMLGAELLGTLASYPDLWDDRTEAFGNASNLVESCRLIPRKILARDGAAGQILAAMDKLDHWADHLEVLAWAAAANT